MRRVAIVVLALVCLTDAVQFGQLCRGNARNTRRTSDGWGSGNYGASRDNGRRTHQGLDIMCTDGATVLAPFDVTIVRRITVYTDPAKAAINNGLELKGGGLCFKLFYVRPVKTSGSVAKGQPLGTMLPMQQVYPGMTSHIHVQMCDRSDPTPYFG